MLGTTLTSPGYPVGYLPNVSRTYPIEVPEGKKIEVRFLDIDLENRCDGECLFDWVKVMDEEDADGDGAEDDEEDILLDKSCYNDKPAVFTSLSNKIMVYFKTDESVQKKGWMLNWKEV